MLIYLHRANTPKMLEQARAYGIGVELDIRTFDGIAFLSHNPISKGNWSEPPMLCSDAFDFIEQHQLPTILDFKESGIVDKLTLYLKSDIYYGTDLIFPDQLWCRENGCLKTLSRISKYEWIQETDGYWFDYMETAYDLDDYKNDICRRGVLVSPELHKFKLSESFISRAKEKEFMGVCTDHPLFWL